MLYVIQASTGPLKVGRAENPIARLRDLQTSNPYGLVLCAEVKARGRADDVHFEQHVHHRLGEHRLSGEWFANHVKCCEMLVDIVVSNGGKIWIPLVPRLDKVDVLARLARIETAIAKLTPTPSGAGGAEVLRKPAVEAMTGRSYSSLRRDMMRGAFPQPVRLGARSVGWRRDEVTGWINERDRGQLQGCPATKAHCQRACSASQCALEALKV